MLHAARQDEDIQSACLLARPRRMTVAAVEVGRDRAITARVAIPKSEPPSKMKLLSEALCCASRWLGDGSSRTVRVLSRRIG